MPEGDSEGHGERDDSHLDLFLLNDEEEEGDDYLFTLSIDAINSEKQSQYCHPEGTGSNSEIPLAGTIFGSPKADTSAGVRDVEERGGGGRGAGGVVLDAKLVRLRAELLQEQMEAESSSVGQVGCREDEEAKEEERCRRTEQENQEGEREEREGEKKDAEEGKRTEEDCKPVDSEPDSSAVSVPERPPASPALPATSSQGPSQGHTCDGASSPLRSEVSQLYTDSDNLASYLQSRGETGTHQDRHPVGETERERATHPSAENGHPVARVVVSTDLPDGCMFSRLPPPSPLSTEQKEEEEEEEEEEEVVFLSLPPLACRLHVGSEEKMDDLREIAVSTLEHVVPLIHASMSEWRRERGGVC